MFIGDNRTFSITLATPTDDVELRKTLTDPVVFDACAAQLVAAQPWLDGRAEPITPEVHVMAGLLNRWREHVVGGQPVATGVIAIGDAVLVHQPLYGRGCSTAFWGAHLLADALDSNPTTSPRRHWPTTPRCASRSSRGTAPRWPRTSRLVGSRRSCSPARIPTPTRTTRRRSSAACCAKAWLPALRLDAVVLRAFMRSLNLLTTPDAMMTDPDVQSRVFAVWEDRGNRPPEEALGPKTRRAPRRDRLVERLLHAADGPVGAVLEHVAPR